ncbi:MAG: DNA polymerase III subunit gamma/tau [bacterium]
MAYQSLYRKYRSRGFNDLVGQNHITQTLANAITSGRVTHAFLFCGPRGTGKTSTARVLAKALNCVHGPTAEPCDVCPLCVSIRNGNAMDFVEIDAASNRNIDDIRQLREQVNYPPVELRYKFYIIDEVHQLTKDSFNAFLKTLEEPPAHVVFVLCTTDPHQLPATILSRCQRFDFHRITAPDIVERMRWIVGQEGWTIEEEALALLARTANGGMRDALSMLDQAASYAGSHITAKHVREILGGIDLALLLEYTDFMLKQDARGLFGLIDRIMSEGKDVPQLVGELVLHWRNLLRVHIGGPDALMELSPEQRDAMGHQAKLAPQAKIMRAITLWCEAENELRWNSQQRLSLELYSLRIMSDEAPVATAIAAAPVAGVAPRPVAAPPRAAAPAAQIEPPTQDAGDTGELTLAKMKKRWPEFLEWMKRSSQLDNLRTRIVEKCWPSTLMGHNVTLATASGFVSSQVQDKPKVKEVLEQCLSTFFGKPLTAQMAVQQETAPAASAPEPVAQEVQMPVMPPPPQNTPPATVETAPVDPNRDIIGERVKQVFTGSEEITN